LHILVVDQPAVDYSYSPDYHDSAGWMRGFDGGAGQLSKNNKAVKLCMPQSTTKPIAKQSSTRSSDSWRLSALEGGMALVVHHGQ